MEKFYNTNNFLAKWSNGTLSKEELEAFKASEDYFYYRAILDGTEFLEIPEYHKGKKFKVLKRRISSYSKCSFRNICRCSCAIAACLVFLMGYFLLFEKGVKHTTGYGEQLNVLLPDNSDVVLDAKSKIKYNKNNWENERKVTLEGHAFFKVHKKGKFMVETANGTITVLGTQFTVYSHKGILEVKCYEGSVLVSNKHDTQTLGQGDGIRFLGNETEHWMLTRKVPSWVSGESVFENAPLNQVIDAIERQYKVSVNIEGIDPNMRYTGGFTHSNIDKALFTVFKPLKIQVLFINRNTIRLTKK